MVLFFEHVEYVKINLYGFIFRRIFNRENLNYLKGLQIRFFGMFLIQFNKLL